MSQIDYYLSPMSPWTHLVGDRAAQIAARRVWRCATSRWTRWRCFRAPAGKCWPTGMTAARRIGCRNWSAGRGAGRADQAASGAFPDQPAPAAYAIIAAQEAGGGDLDALVTGLTRACWEEDRDIAEDDVIRDCLPPPGSTPGWRFRACCKAPKSTPATWKTRSRRASFGVPFFVVGDARFWGQDRLDFWPIIWALQL